MGKDREKEPKIRFFGRIRQSLRAQLSLIVLLSYLLPVLLLGVFTGSLLLHRLEEQTRTAVTSGAEQAWTLTEQNVERTLELARDATYDGELTDTWQKWNDGAIGDAEYMRLCRNYLERKYSREQLISFAACFPVKNPEIFMYPRGGTAYSTAELQDLREAVLAEGETLDTRCRFICVGERMYLVRNLLSLRMENLALVNVFSSLVGASFVFLFSTRFVFRDSHRIPLRLKYAIYIAYQLVLIFLISKLLAWVHLLIVSHTDRAALVSLAPVLAKILVTPVTMTVNFFAMKTVIEKL